MFCLGFCISTWLFLLAAQRFVHLHFFSLIYSAKTTSVAAVFFACKSSQSIRTCFCRYLSHCMVLVKARIALFGLCCFFCCYLPLFLALTTILCPYDPNSFDDHFVAIPKKDVVNSFLLPPEIRYHHHHLQFEPPTLPLYKGKYIAIMPHNRDASRDSRDRDMIVRSQTVPMYVQP